MELNTYRNFTHRLQESLESDSRVIGLVAAGSMAERNRLPDNWSDHDFFVITEPGVQEAFRQDLSWLPDHKQIVLSVRETEHGLKVLYDFGHILEFAIFDREELKMARVNDYRVLLDRAEIEVKLQKLEKDTVDSVGKYDAERGFSLFLSLLLIGSGRYARGEVLSSHRFIKEFALSHLMNILIHALPTDNHHKLDNLDPFRRFEQVYPAIGEALHQALLLPPVEAAQGLLSVAKQHLKDHLAFYPEQAIQVVGDYLARVQESHR